MFITSLGIFGYLSASYQKSSLIDKSNEEKIQIYESKKSSYVEKISQSKLRIKTIEDLRLAQERRLSETMTNTFIVRNPIQLQEMQSQTMEFISNSEKNIDGENKKIQESNDEIFKLNEVINQFKLSGREQSDIITFKFVADEFQMTMNKVVKWFISILISVFDPLAICLLLSYNNIIFLENKKKNNIIEDKIVDNINLVNNIDTNMNSSDVSNVDYKKVRRHDVFSRLFRNN